MYSFMGRVRLMAGGRFHTRAWQAWKRWKCCSVCGKDVTIQQEKKHKGACSLALLCTRSFYILENIFYR